jgi:hypothetical protein
MRTSTRRALPREPVLGGNPAAARTRNGPRSCRAKAKAVAWAGTVPVIGRGACRRNLRMPRRVRLANRTLRIHAGCFLPGPNLGGTTSGDARPKNGMGFLISGDGRSFLIVQGGIRC